MSKKPQKTRRRWWQIFCRIALILVLLAAGIYITLPWWLPRDFLRNHIAERLAQDLGKAVQIKKLSLSWANGLDIQGLRIGSNDKNEPVAIVDAIRTEFSPASLLLRNRLEWLEIIRPKIFIKADKEGQLNISSIIDLLSKSESPKLFIKNISIRHGVIILALPERKTPIRLNVSDLQFVAGKLNQLGQVTMSAGLEQSGSFAPLGLTVGPGSGEKDAVAAAALNFSNLDLEELELKKFLDLSLRQLSGQCSGSLNLQVNQQGVVDRFSFNLSIRDLNVQPTDGPEFPVIEQAGLKIDALYDPIMSELQLSSAVIRLPGVDLSGKASMSTAIRNGNWEAIKSLDLKGKVHPNRLAALLEDFGQDDRGLMTEGPIALSLTARQEGTNLRVNLVGDGTSTAIAKKQRVIKPAGRNFIVSLTGAFDRRNWQFSADQAGLIIGENDFVTSGTLTDIRPVLDGLLESQQPPKINDLFGYMANLDLQGTFEVNEFYSLKDIWPELEEALEDVDFQGELKGRWFIAHGENPRLHATLRAPEQTSLSIGDNFAKPFDKPMTIALAAEIDSDLLALNEINFDMTVGPGRFNIDKGFLKLTADSSGTAVEGVEAIGRYDAQQADILLKCLPKFKELSENIRGTADGEYSLSVAQDSGLANISANMAHMELDFPGVFIKPLSRKAIAQLEYNFDNSAADARNIIKTEVEFENASVVSNLSFPANTTSQTTVNLDAAAKVEDAIWLVESCPFLAEALANGNLEGQTIVEMQAILQEDEILGQIHCQGSQLRYDSAEPVEIKARLENGLIRRINLGHVQKPSGIPAEFSLDIRLLPGASRLYVNNLYLHLSESSVLADCLIDYEISQDGQIENLKAKQGHVVVNTKDAKSLQVIAPSLEQYQLSGSAFFETQFSCPQKDKPQISYALLKTDKFGGTFNGKDVLIDGKLAFENLNQDSEGFWQVGRFSTDSLEFSIGENHGWVLADLTDLPNAPHGKFELICDRLDDKDLIDWLAPAREEIPAIGPAAYKITSEKQAQLREQAQQIIEKATPFILSSNLAAKIKIHRLRNYDVSIKTFYDVSNLRLDFSSRQGKVDINYINGLNGGTVRREYSVDLNQENPRVFFSTDISNTIARENMQPQINKVFPGNLVSGEFNHSEEVDIDLVDFVANAIDFRYKFIKVGSAITVTTNGVIEGQAAPAFVTKLLPGLNTTEYSYDKMTNYAEFLPDGTADNDMVFSGNTYDLYIEGITDFDNIGKYEIGPILLGSPQSAQWNHIYRQGRIPVLKFKARIEGGKMYDIKVSYPWPNETLFTIFLKNNIFYRLWLSGKQSTVQ